MVPINKSLILNSHRAKKIIRKNVWKFSLQNDHAPTQLYLGCRVEDTFLNALGLYI